MQMCLLYSKISFHCHDEYANHFKMLPLKSHKETDEGVN